MNEKNENEIGTVISSPEGPSPSSLDFVVHSGVLHKGMFVELDYSEGTMVCLVTDVMKSNRYFERFESVKEFESSGKKLFEQFPAGEWEYLIGITKPLGVYSNNGIKRATFPPSPGTKVRIASQKTIENLLGFDLKSGLHLGTVDHHNVPVKLNLSRTLQKHLAILAMSGAGKSYFTSVLLEELLSRKKEDGRIAIIIMDAHGEYRSFADPVTDQKYKDFSSMTRYIKASEIQIGVPKLSSTFISSILPGISQAQERDLARIIEKLKKEMKEGAGPFDFSSVKSEIYADEEMKENTKQALTGWISSLEQMDLFGKVDSPSITDLVAPGKLTIIDLSDIIDIRKKQAIVSYYAHKLFSSRRMGKICPFNLVIEEAHQFAPEKVARENAISKKIIETIAREGRKFGASICLISQRPTHLSTTALSQCNTHIILRVTNPNDVENIGKLSEGLDKRSLDMITTLRVGEALIVGEAVNYPVFFKVRKRTSQESRHETTLEKAAREFEERQTEKEKDIENYL